MEDELPEKGKSKKSKKGKKGDDFESRRERLNPDEYLVMLRVRMTKKAKTKQIVEWLVGGGRKFIFETDDEFPQISAKYNLDKYIEKGMVTYSLNSNIILVHSVGFEYSCSQAGFDNLAENDYRFDGQSD